MIDKQEALEALESLMLMIEDGGGGWDLDYQETIKAYIEQQGNIKPDSARTTNPAYAGVPVSG